MGFHPATNEGAWTILQSPCTLDAELYLLFAKGKRPDSAAIKAFASRLPDVTVTHDPPAHDTPCGDGPWQAPLEWTELLRDGLTFDLDGLAPGPAAAIPEIRHRFDLPRIPEAGDFDAVLLRPGPHVTAAGSALPLMRSLLALGCDMVRQFDDLAAVVWTPSGSAIGRQFFESATSAWLDGGPFPGLGLTAFTVTPDNALESEGLSFWIGQELRIEPQLNADHVAATRLGIRLVNYLVLTGRLVDEDRITALDGTRLLLRPSRKRALVSVWRE